MYVQWKMNTELRVSLSEAMNCTELSKYSYIVL